MATLDDRSLDGLTDRTVDLLQTLIRNECVNDGTTDSGHETRNVDVLEQVVSGPSVDIERFEPVADRASMVARIAGSDPDAPTLCLMAHTDVVPVHPRRVAARSVRRRADRRRSVGTWRGRHVEPHRVDGGVVSSPGRRGGGRVGSARRATSSTSLSPTRSRAAPTARAGWRTIIPTRFVPTTSSPRTAGCTRGRTRRPFVGVNVAEKGVAWRKLTVRGTPGHGSMPFRKDNALVKAAGVVQRLADYRPAPRFTELWRTRVDTLGLPDRHAPPPARRTHHRRVPRRPAVGTRRGAPPRVHPHHVLAEPRRRRRR